MQEHDPYKPPDTEIENEEEIYIPLYKRMRACLFFCLLGGNAVLGVLFFLCLGLNLEEKWLSGMISIAILWNVVCVVGLALVSGIGHVRDDFERKRY